MSTNILDALPVYPDEPPAPRPRPTPWKLPLHPNFWWSLGWCFVMLVVTQLFGAVLVVVPFVFYLMATKPDLMKGGDSAALMNDPLMQVALGVAQWFAHFLIIVLSLVLLRVVAGRDWRREVALRLPSFSHFLLVVALWPAFFVAAGVASYVAKDVLGFPGFKNAGQMIAFVGSLVTSLAVTGAAWGLVSAVFGRDWAKRLLGPTPSFRAALLSAVLLATFLNEAIFFYNLYSSLPFLRRMGPMEGGGIEKFMETINGWPLPLAIFVIGVMPGLSEELWCRAYLGRGLVGKHGYWWGVILASFLFGFIHIDPVQGTMAACVGLLLHYVYLMTRSLVAPMLLHFLNNSLAVVLNRFPKLGELEQGGVAGLEWPLMAVAAAAFLVVGAVMYALYQSRARLETPEGATPWLPPYPGVVCPPRDSATEVVAPTPSALSALLVLSALGAFAGGVFLVARAMM